MAAISPGFTQIHPSLTLPEIVMQVNQPTGAFKALSGGSIVPRLGASDLAVYIKRLNVKTAATVSQNRGEQLPSCSFAPLMISAPTYLLRNRVVYDHHDISNASIWGYSLVEAYRLASRQGIANTARTGLLYGFNPNNPGEGLLNAPGITQVLLPADTDGNDTVTTYDPAQMAQFIVQQVVNTKLSMYQMGNPLRAAILGPQRVLANWAYRIVSLLNYQRPGAGVASIQQTAEAVLGWNDDTIVDYLYDDTLIGKGQNGTDAVIIIVPEIMNPHVGSTPDTNLFADLHPNMSGNFLMLSDMAAPREITSPLPDGAVSTVYEIRSTPGWVIRPQGVTVMSMQYS